MRNHKKPNSRGFTLVELLVVIAIIAVLAAVAFSLGPKMLRKAKATEAMQNLRQIGPVLSTYASEHNNKLPPIRAEVKFPDGSTGEQYWHEACLALMYPNTALSEFKSQVWWDNNKTIFRNPLLKKNSKPRGFSPTSPGFGMNEMIAENIAISTTGSAPGHLQNIAVSVPLAAIPDPGRTPIVAPSDTYYYRYDDAQISQFQRGTLKELSTDGKVPILFLDGHAEAMTPKEYRARNLSKIPLNMP